MSSGMAFGRYGEFMAKKAKPKDAAAKPPAHLRVEFVSTPPKLPPRSPDAHKGDFGRVLIIGGSRGMIGAPALVANAALRAGAGLVTVACPETIQPSVAVLCPCATTIPLSETPYDQIDPVRALARIDDTPAFADGAKPDVIALGPGIGRGTAQFNNGWCDLVSEFSSRRGIPTVIDADGLNALPAVDLSDESAAALELSNVILTPHPGEMGRLCGLSAADVQSRREHIAVACARKLRGRGGAVVLLKGAGTLVTDGARVYRNNTGNPGMATGGAGDVLTGIIAALVGQGLSLFDAASLGAHVHGMAGDLGARVMSQTSLIATDLIDRLPVAFSTLR